MDEDVPGEVNWNHVRVYMRATEGRGAKFVCGKIIVDRAGTPEERVFDTLEWSVCKVEEDGTVNEDYEFKFDDLCVHPNERDWDLEVEKLRAEPGRGTRQHWEARRERQFEAMDTHQPSGSKTEGDPSSSSSPSQTSSPSPKPVAEQSSVARGKAPRKRKNTEPGTSTVAMDDDSEVKSEPKRRKTLSKAAKEKLWAEDPEAAYKLCKDNRMFYNECVGYEEDSLIATYNHELVEKVKEEAVSKTSLAYHGLCDENAERFASSWKSLKFKQSDKYHKLLKASEHRRDAYQKEKRDQDAAVHGKSNTFGSYAITAYSEPPPLPLSIDWTHTRPFRHTFEALPPRTR